MRHGHKVADVPAGVLDEQKLIEMIVGLRSAESAAASA